MHISAGALTAGVASHVCVAYAGTKLAAGVIIYVNGMAQTPTVVSDTLGSASFAQSAPLIIGTAYAGAIGNVQIFNGRFHRRRGQPFTPPERQSIDPCAPSGAGL
jgi:hypothetical protein